MVGGERTDKREKQAHRSLLAFFLNARVLQRPVSFGHLLLQTDLAREPAH